MLKKTGSLNKEPVWLTCSVAEGPDFMVQDLLKNYFFKESRISASNSSAVGPAGAAGAGGVFDLL